jgi:hypothetical protein
LLATGLLRLRPLFIQEGKYLFDDHRVLNAGIHFDGAALAARFDWGKRHDSCIGLFILGHTTFQGSILLAVTSVWQV